MLQEYLGNNKRAATYTAYVTSRHLLNGGLDKGWTPKMR